MRRSAGSPCLVAAPGELLNDLVRLGPVASSHGGRMKKLESVPDPVCFAAAGIFGGQLVRLVGSTFQVTEWVGLGIAVIAVVLLIGGTAVGWILAAFWAFSAVSGPFVFGSPIWIGVVGLV